MSYLIPSDNQIEDFCLALIQGKTNGQAFRAAFPDSDALDTTATNHGSKIAKLPVIRARLRELAEVGRTATNAAWIDDVTTRKQQLSSIGRHGSQLKDEKDIKLGFVDSGGANKAIDTHNKMDNVYQHGEFDDDIVIIRRNVPGRGADS